MADNSILKDLLNGTLDMVVPHARKEPLNPMAYVKDVNEWFVPSAQMALDEAEGTAEYPAWAYGLASAPFIGKLAKPIAKVAGKTAAKGAAKAAKYGEKEAQELMNKVANAKDYYNGGAAYQNFVKSEHPDWVPSMSLDEAKAIEKDLRENTPYFNGMTREEVASVDLNNLTTKELEELAGDVPPIREGFKKTAEGGLETAESKYNNKGDVILRNNKTGEVITPNGNFGGLGVEPMHFGSDTEASYFLKEMFGDGRGYEDGWRFEKQQPSPEWTLIKEEPDVSSLETQRLVELYDLLEKELNP